jgi:hypothetical protein
MIYGMRKNSLLLLFTGFLCVAGSVAQAALSVDDQARLLGGFAPRQRTAETDAIRNSGQWNSQNFQSIWGVEGNIPGQFNNLFAPSVQSVSRAFFANNLGRAADTRNLIYFYGGADVFWPFLMFPRLEKVVMVGLEPAGMLLNPQTLVAQGALSGRMSGIVSATDEVLAYSYFITSRMQSELASYGTATIMAVGLVAQNFQLLAVEPVAVNASGQLAVGGNGNVRGVRLQFVKPDGVRGEVIYFSKMLSNDSLPGMPEFSHFIRNGQFDTAYFKAASYVPHRGDSSAVNQLVMSSVRNVVQADNGIPFSYFLREANSWSVRLFGIYTRASVSVFSAGYEQGDLRNAYQAKLCDRADARDQQLFTAAWGLGRCQASPNNFGFRSLSWEGTIPFHYDYSAISGPGSRGHGFNGSIAWQEMKKWGTLQVLEKN